MTIKEKYEDYCNRGLIRPWEEIEYDEDTGFYCNYYYPKNLTEKQMEKEIKKAEKCQNKLKKRKFLGSIEF